MASSAVPKARILVVDDDAKTVASVRLYLEHAGYRVDAATDGRAALERARGTRRRTWSCSTGCCPTSTGWPSATSGAV